MLNAHCRKTGMKKHFLSWNFLRFSGIGIICTFLNLGLLTFQVEVLSMNYTAAIVVCFWLVNYIGFYLNRHFSFQASNGNFFRQAKQYYVIMGCSLLANLTLMMILVEYFEFHYFYSSLLVTGLFFMGNFLAHKLWTFRT